MIIFNGKHIIDVFTNDFTIKKGIYNESIVYTKGIQYIGAHEINTGDASEFALIINKNVYTNIEIKSNNEGLIIENNKIYFNQSGEYNIELKYKTIKKEITVFVSDIIISIQ